MKKLISVSLVLFFVTVALGEGNQGGMGNLESAARAIEFFDVYLEEHPDLTKDQRDVLICAREVSQALVDNGKLQPWQESLGRVIERELQFVFDLDQLIEFGQATRQVKFSE